MPAFKNVTIAGASGELGSLIFKRLIKPDDFKVRVLKRAGSTSTFPDGTDVIEVEYLSLDSLTAALKDQDVLVSAVTTSAAKDQEILIDAAVAAGVKRVLPAEFGCNNDAPAVRELPFYTDKVRIQENIIEYSKTTSLSYTFVHNGVGLDWGLRNNFFLDFEKSTATLIDGGNAEFSTTTFPTIAKAVYSILCHPEATRNRVKANPEKTWNVVDVKLSDVVAKAEENYAKGILDHETLGNYLLKAVYHPSSEAKFKKLDNELLDVKGKSEDEVVELIRPLV
ncbi:hypothetical protein NW759_017278 [Fusarium solani]|nr:hypothetical protein NW759_017278 [Fusarium solani]